MANKAQANLKYFPGYGENFRALRESYMIDGKPCTVRQLSKLFSKNGVGISYSTISDIENERDRKPTIEQVQIYHDFFNVPFDYLTGEKKTRKKDLVEICEYTGLSQEAVEMLHNLTLNSIDDVDIKSVDEIEERNKERAKVLEMLSCLLANTEKHCFLDSLSMIVKYDKEYKRITSEAQEEYSGCGSNLSSHPIYFEEDLELCETFVKNLRFAKSYYYDAIEYLQEAIKLYVKVNITTDETESVIQRIESLNYNAKKEKENYYEVLLNTQWGD